MILFCSCCNSGGWFVFLVSGNHDADSAKGLLDNVLPVPGPNVEGSVLYVFYPGPSGGCLVLYNPLLRLQTQTRISFLSAGGGSKQRGGEFIAPTPPQKPDANSDQTAGRRKSACRCFASEGALRPRGPPLGGQPGCRAGSRGCPPRSSQSAEGVFQRAFTDRGRKVSDKNAELRSASV